MSRDYATETGFPTDQMNGSILIAQYLLQLSIHLLRHFNAFRSFKKLINFGLA